MALGAVNSILIVFYVFVFTSGIAGNILVIKWFGTKEERKKAGNKLVIALAFNDFLSSIFIPLFQIHFIVIGSIEPHKAWYLGKVLCHSQIGMHVTFVMVTSFLLVAIAVERFRYGLIHKLCLEFFA